MRRFNTMQQTVVAGAAMVIMTLVGGAPLAGAAQQTAVVEVAAAPGDQDGEAKKEKRTSNFVFIDEQDGDRQEVRIELVEGVPVVWVNGRKLDDDRIKRHENRLILLDEQGNEMKSVRLWSPDDVKLRRLAELEARATANGGGRAFAATVPVEELRMRQPEPTVMLGVYMDEPDEALIRHLKLKEDATTLVTGVYEGLPAHKAGIEQYDIIVKIEDAERAAPADIRDVLQDREAGQNVELEIIHEGERRTVAVELEAYDRQRMAEARMLGSAPGRRRMDNVVVAPGRDGQWQWHLPQELRVELNNERLERLVTESLRKAEQRAREALRATEGAQRDAERTLREKVREGDWDLEKSMQALEQRMEQLESMLERLGRQLEEKLAEDESD